MNQLLLYIIETSSEKQLEPNVCGSTPVQFMNPFSAVSHYLTEIREGVSTAQCSWLVSEVTTYFMVRDTPVSASLLDCSKAFDKCRFDQLFNKL